MQQDCGVQPPRQIYASTLNRRDRRWARRRGRGPRGLALLTLATVAVAVGALATFAPGIG